MFKRYLISTIFCAVLVSAPLIAQTHSSAANAAGSDMQAWEHYRLTMPKVDKWAAANRKIGAYLKAHPELKNKRDMSNAKSLAEIESRVKAEAPGLVEQIERSGLSFSDWWNTNLALSMAYLAVEYEKPGMPAPRFASPENIAFVKANKQKIASLMAEYEKWNKQFSNKQ